jgi:tetratricopeptide (TPR) repeat protein
VAYQEALRYRIPQAEPQEYAMLQNNLGIAFWSLAQHERSIPWLEQAIDAYQTALVYRTLATTPAGCAATQNNLGTAYWDLAQQQTHQPDERLLSLRQAVEAYEAALDAVDQALQQSPTVAPGFDLWATCHSAGIVHDQLALALPTDQQTQRQHHLNAALNHYLTAYQGWRDQPEQLDVLAEALVYSVRLHFEVLGLTGQQIVLSKLPPELLGRVLPQM